MDASWQSCYAAISSVRVIRHIGSEPECHHLCRFGLGDDGQCGKSIRVGCIPLIVIVMPVRIEQIADRLVRPLANFRNVFARAGRQITGINHQHADIADDDHRIPLGKMIRGILVPN